MGNMAVGFDQNINQVVFSLELEMNANRSEQILWHGLVDGQSRVLNVDFTPVSGSVSASVSCEFFRLNRCY